MAITDKEKGVWGLDQVYNKINQGSIWAYNAPGGDAARLFAWGGNTFGELYLAGVTGGEPARRSSPVQIPGLTWKDLANMAGKTTYQSMASKTDGTLWLWGRNQYGSIGNSTPAASYQSSPIQIPGTNWTGTYDTMSCGYSTTRAIKTNGEMWSWGYNGSGNSGVNNRTHYSSPVQVPGTTWAVTAGTSYAEYAIRTDGTLWSWGYNVQGALGLNQPHPTKISSPTQVPGTTWSKISCGERNAFALKTDGTFWVWGRNETGWLGLNEGANPGPSKSSPCQIPGTTWTSNYAVTLQGALAIKTDGTLWSWGKNNWGSLGHNNQTDYSSPVQIGSETTWSSVKVGGAYKVRAIKTDGTLWSWGYNNQGQLGDNSTVHRSSPVQVGSDTTWSKIGGTGAKTSYAIKNIEG